MISIGQCLMKNWYTNLMEDIQGRQSSTYVPWDFQEFQIFCAKCHPKSHHFHRFYLLHLLNTEPFGITYLKPSKFQNPKPPAMERPIYKLYNFTNTYWRLISKKNIASIWTNRITIKLTYLRQKDFEDLLRPSAIQWVICIWCNSRTENGKLPPPINFDHPQDEIPLLGRRKSQGI